MPNSTIIQITWMMMMMILLLLLYSQLHPVPILIMCMIYNIILSINMSLSKSSSLLPLMFILMMISGLLIIFLYFSSLISNEKTWTKHNSSMLYLIMIPAMITMTLLNNYTYKIPHSTNSPEHQTIIMTHSPPLLPDHSMLLMFKAPMSPMTLISMIYLLICLMTVIKITSPNTKTLRKLS